MFPYWINKLDFAIESIFFIIYIWCENVWTGQKCNREWKQLSHWFTRMYIFNESQAHRSKRQSFPIDFPYQINFTEFGFNSCFINVMSISVSWYSRHDIGPGYINMIMISAANLQLCVIMPFTIWEVILRKRLYFC